MRRTRMLSIAAASMLPALAACGGGGGGEEGEQIAAADLVGYYVYSDPARGTSHLALLNQQRFFLIQEPAPQGGAPAEAAPQSAPGGYGGGSEGTVGWYIVQGDSIYLNSERLYARGHVSPEVLRVVFQQPLVPGAGGADYPMPFQKRAGGAAPQEQEGGGQGEEGESGGGGGGEQREREQGGGGS